jgi:plasmid stabilization system protein ParE
MRLRFSPRAVLDLSEIADYIRERDPNAAGRVRTAILQSLEILTAFPLIGRQQDVEGVRKLVVRRYRYLVYYAADEELGEVTILSIQHPARRRIYHDT